MSRSSSTPKATPKAPTAGIPAPAAPGPAVEDTTRQILTWLQQQRDPERARGVQQYFRHEIVALGIDTPTLRAFAARLARSLLGAWGLADALALADRLLQEPEQEARGLGILLLGRFQRVFRPTLMHRGRRWLETRLDNWALVDTFCSTVLSPLLQRHPEVENTLRAWSHARRLWVRRAALVTFVPFARHGRHLDTAYALAAERLADPEDLMHKAVGWLLREAGKTDLPRLRRFLLERGPVLPRTALRYAIERFPAAERRRLLAATRRPTTV